jgi:1-acyl-sn-glycerol-3-phosphate acyltransferase
MKPRVYDFCRWLVREGFFRLSGGIVGVDRENVPMTGPVIFAPLHVSHLDPPAVACAMRRRTHFMAKEELFRNPIFGALIRALGAFPVRRGEGDSEAIRTSIRLLEGGEAVLLFPEGTRGTGERIQPINRGVAMLAKRTNAPIVPVGVKGTREALGRDSRGRRRRHLIEIAYGEPFTYDQVASGANEKENREIFAAELERRIVAACHRIGYPIKSSSHSPDSPASTPPETPGGAEAASGADTPAR